jgi:hypothetical protein
MTSFKNIDIWLSLGLKRQDSAVAPIFRHIILAYYSAIFMSLQKERYCDTQEIHKNILSHQKSGFEHLLKFDLFGQKMGVVTLPDLMGAQVRNPVRISVPRLTFSFLHTLFSILLIRTLTSIFLNPNYSYVYCSVMFPLPTYDRFITVLTWINVS